MVVKAAMEKCTENAETTAHVEQQACDKLLNSDKLNETSNAEFYAESNVNDMTSKESTTVHTEEDINTSTNINNEDRDDEKVDKHYDSLASDTQQTQTDEQKVKVDNYKLNLVDKTQVRANETVFSVQVEHLATLPTCTQLSSGSKQLDVGQRKSKSLLSSTSSSDELSSSSKTNEVSDGNESNTEIEENPTLRKLFELEKVSGIWTQQMQIELRGNQLDVIDNESNVIIESYDSPCVTQIQAFNHYNEIYNNLLVFTILIENDVTSSSESDNHEDEKYDKNTRSELNIFQCVSHDAQTVVDKIIAWKNITSSEASLRSTHQDFKAEENKGSMFSRSNSQQSSNKVKESCSQSSKPIVHIESSAPTNDAQQMLASKVNVRETVQAFNQIAALHEQTASSGTSSANASKSTSPTNNARLVDACQSYRQRSVRASLTPMIKTSEDDYDDDDDGRAKQPASNPNSSSGASSASSTSLSTKQASTEVKSSFSQSSKLSNSTNTTKQRSLATACNSNDGSNSSSSISGNASGVATQMRDRRAIDNRTTTTNSNRHQRNRGADSAKSAQVQRSSKAQLSTNESYISVLNHCFDDIEKFIVRLQRALSAARQLEILHQQQQQHQKKQQRDLKQKPAENLLSTSTSSSTSVVESKAARMAAKMPTVDDFYAIFSKFKLAFNLLAKLKGCIHEPNAPELVHFLFTPLAIIDDAARNAEPPVDPSLVDVPYLNRDAIDLLTNCCTSKESDLWLSLGPSWTRVVRMSKLQSTRLPSSFQPIFTDGWAPLISDLDLIGLKPSEAFHDPPRASSRHYYNCSSSDYQMPNRILTLNDEFRRRSKLRLPSFTSGNMRAYMNQSANLEYADEYDEYNDRHLLMKATQMRDSKALYYERHRFPRNDENFDSEYSTLIASTDYINTKPYNDARLRSVSSEQQRHPDYHQKLYDYNNYLEKQCEKKVVNNNKSCNSKTNSYNDKESEKSTSKQYLANNQSGQPSTIKNQKLINNKQSPEHHFSTIDDSTSIDSDYEAILIDLGPVQADWLNILQARGARVVRVLFTRAANNEKELSVQKGEVLELVDNSRRWWRVININMEIGHVPHTIVAEMDGYQTLDELLAMSTIDDENVKEYEENNRIEKRRVSSNKPSNAFRYF